jgi:hypothetical protein
MQSRWFWNTWLNDFKWIWYILLCAFLFGFLLLWFDYTKGVESVIHWDKIQEQKVLESVVHSFNVGPFELIVPGENFVILEYFNGSHIQLNQFVLNAFIIVLTLCVVTLLSIITTIERFWYFVGMALFILFVVSLRLDVLNIFGQRNQIPTISALSLYIITSFYFQSINKSVSFSKRLAVFLVLTAVVGLMIYFFAQVPYPFLHLSVTYYSSALVLSVIFCLMVAHEIPASFVYIVSQGHTKNLRHFSLISVIYIFNVIVTCLHELGVIHWTFIYTNLYLLISISGILGLWGFRHRENLYENIFPFAPYGAYLYAALASICFITIAQFIGTANDPALHVIRDVIIFSHVGYGVIFLTYVFSNFILMFAQNMPVYKVLYKSNRMPYFTFRLAGLIMTLGFVFYSGWQQYVYNSIAGFYNNIGDLYEFLDRSAISEAYYEQGKNYGFANNHANYALANLKIARYDLEAAHKNLEWANVRTPNVFSITNEANLYSWENHVRESITAYREGINRMSGSGEMYNNLGFTYGKLRYLDSAVYYLGEARKYKNSKSSAEANFIAVAGLEYLPIKCDSVLKQFDNPYPASIGNAIAVATVQRQGFKTEIDVLRESRLNLSSATLLNNYIIRNAKALDSSFLTKAYHIASDSLNSDYNEALKASLAFAYYHQGNVTRALQVLGELVYLSQSYRGKYNYIMGLWALEQNNANLAASYFKYAVDDNYKKGRLYYAIALTEDRREKEALVAWDSVAIGKDEAAKAMAQKLKYVLSVPSKEVLALNDPDKYQYCRYKLKVSDTLFFNRIVNSFQDENYKAQALLDITQRFFERGDLLKAIRYFNQIGGLKLTDEILYKRVQHTELMMLAERKELRTLAKQINKGLTFSNEQALEKMYYTALLNEAASDTINAARNFEVVGTYNPYFEQGIIAAADFFRSHSKNKMKAYNILVEAIQVNNRSIKLLNAYAKEASSLGFNDYAFSATQQIAELERPGQ